MSGAGLQPAVRPVEEDPDPAPENATIPHLQMAGRSVQGNSWRLKTVTRSLALCMDSGLTGLPGHNQQLAGEMDVDGEIRQEKEPVQTHPQRWVGKTVPGKLTEILDFVIQLHVLNVNV